MHSVIKLRHLKEIKLRYLTEIELQHRHVHWKKSEQQYPYSFHGLE